MPSVISSISPAMPYTPASPLDIRATVFPLTAASMAIRHRSASRRMGVSMYSLSGYRGLTSSLYTPYPAITSAASRALAARRVISSADPGPMPTTQIFRFISALLFYLPGSL